MSQKQESTTPGAPIQAVRVWDLPTRLFHWSLVLCVVGAVISAKMGGNAMVWHLRLGYAVLALLGFRLLWGLVGGRWSRFSSFLYSPAALLRYLRGQALPDDHFDVGHNPLGAFSVLAMLAWLLAQVATGLVADDEIATTGPLVGFVSSELSLAWTSYHKSYGQWGLFALVGLHLVAIVFYRVWQRKNLLGPMFSGDKPLAAAVPSSHDSWATRLFALTLLAACSAGVYLLINLSPA